MDLDDAIPICHDVYWESLNVSRMAVATHERGIIRATYCMGDVVSANIEY